jgi:DNA-binding response OmpR family regulator
MKKIILAIDDSKAIRFLLQTILTKEYQVVTIPDGYSAMYWLSRGNVPDLIVADPQLPDMDNWELIQHLYTNRKFEKIPILVLSALNKSETWSKCIEYKVHGYFMKPFNPVDLVNSINVLMKRQPFGQEYFNAN